jgi:SNF family Na+-dependent transporter
MNMKKSMTIFLLMCLSLAGVGQSTEWLQPSSADYLEKSKRQKKTGFILLGVGGTVYIVSSLITVAGVDYRSIDSWRTAADEMDKAVVGAVIGGAGILCAIASVPLFIASARNKKKAASISGALQMERLPAVVTSRPMPALSLRLQW